MQDLLQIAPHEPACGPHETPRKLSGPCKTQSLDCTNAAVLGTALCAVHLARAPWAGPYREFFLVPGLYILNRIETSPQQ